MDIYCQKHSKTEAVLAAAIAKPDVAVSELEVSNMLNDLLDGSVEHPFMLEYVLAALSKDTSTFLEKWFLDRFPSNAALLLEGPCWPILSSLALRLFFSGSVQASPDTLQSMLSFVQAAPGMIQTLTSQVFPEHAPEDDDHEVAQTVAGQGGPRPRRLPQKEKKRADRDKRRMVNVNPSPFRAFDLDVPKTQSEADDVARQVMDRLRELLKLYLELLRRTEVADAIVANMHSTESAILTTTEAAQPIPASVEEGPRPIDHSAFPMVQPMRAALYFDSAKGFGEWRLLVSSRAEKTLRETRKKEPATFQIIVKKLKELSNGHFSADNQKRLSGPSTEIPIFEAKLSRDLRLVYQVDCVSEFGTEVERQVLKIFGLYTHAKLDQRLWDSVGRQVASRGGKEYKHRCTFRNKPLCTGDNVIMPASFPPLEHVREATLQLPDIHPQDMDELHALLVLEKFVTFSQAFLHSIIANQDVTHPFAVSPQEQEIIEHPGSCYVIGRSGTGKTTTMLFKMLGLERTWYQHRDSMPRPRQVFVTQSRMLASKVEEYFGKMLGSLNAGAAKSARELEMLLAARPRNDFGLVVADDEDQWRSDLPKRFSELSDEHFPLFVTFERLCALLHADIEDNVQEPTLHIAECQNSSDEYQARYQNGLVTYKDFIAKYWSHFPQSDTKGLDPALVFNEFIGTLKGSEGALLTENGYLDRSGYVNLSHRTQSTFASKRETIYDLFQIYLKRKVEYRDYDAADRAHRILQALHTQGISGKRIDYLYVDEVQDNLLIDSLVLRMLCANPHGLFFAGDTAQTISIGTTFRFDDLKAFLFRIAEQSSSPVIGKISQPRSFQLLVNYRSHGGIVACAASLVALITNFWPYAIDKLSEETGIIDGLKPTFFSGFSQDTVRYEQFLFGDSGAHIEFGARQCVLVRNEAAKERLRADVGEIGIIMTLYESKGLEFDDVLLYNFFEDSTVDAPLWRVVLNALKTSYYEDVAAPRFDESRHASICGELKSLYVAITRARKNIWIVDCSDKGEPLRIFWTAKDLIQVCTPGMDVPQLAVSSTQEEWIATAWTLFHKKRFLQAGHAFQRAGFSREAAVCHAYQLREDAQVLPIGKKKAETARSIAFLMAADAFMESAAAADTEKLSYYRIAAQCYLSGHKDDLAAFAFLQAKQYTQAAQHYRRAAMFDQAVEVIQSHSSEIPSSVAERILDVARIHYFKEQALEKAATLFNTVEEELVFVEEYDLDVAQAALLESSGRYEEAAELHIKEGRPSEGIKLLLSCNVASAAEYILEELRCHLSFGTTLEITERQESVSHLLELVEGPELVRIDKKYAEEFNMFQALMDDDRVRLRQLAKSFYLDAKQPNFPAALLCLDHCRDSLLDVDATSPVETIAALQTVEGYTNMLRTLSTGSDICLRRGVQRLFGLTLVSEEDFCVASCTYLYNEIITRRLPVARLTDQGLVVAKSVLSTLVEDILLDRLRVNVTKAERICSELGVFSACVAHVSSGSCHNAICRQQHPSGGIVDFSWYNTQVQLHLQPILILKHLMPRLNSSSRAHYRRRWLGRLYEVLFPSHFSLGSYVNLDPNFLIGKGQGTQVVREWLREYINELHLEAHHAFLTGFARAVTLALIFDTDSALDYVRRAPCIGDLDRRPRPFFRDGDYILSNLINALDTNHQNSSAHGIYFLSHIVDTRLNIDISTLCDLLEFLCSCVIITLKARNAAAPLHGLVLPRTWILRTIGNIHGLALQHQLPVQLLIEIFPKLLRQIDAGADHIRNRSRPLQSNWIKILFLYRVCKAAALLSRNLRNPYFKDKIHWGITSLVPCARSVLCEPFFQARGWHDLGQAAERSTLHSPFDMMIQLHHASRVLPPFSPKFMRRIVYEDPADIPALLGRAVATAINGTANRAALSPAPLMLSHDLRDESNGDTASVGEIVQSVSTLQDTTPANDAEAMEEEIDVTGDRNVEEAETSGDIASLAAALRGHVTDHGHLPSAAEIAAAQVIQAAFRRYKRRGRAVSRSKIAEARDVLSTQCLARSRTMEWPHRYYRLLYRGILPHLLVCLQHTRTWAVDYKRKLKKRRETAEHTEYEEMMERQTTTNSLLKTIRELESLLRVESDLHISRDLVHLETKAQEVADLIADLPVNASEPIANDIALVVKAILTKARPPKPQPKPSLGSVDDEFSPEDWLEDNEVYM